METLLSTLKSNPKYKEIKTSYKHCYFHNEVCIRIENLCCELDLDKDVSDWIDKLEMLVTLHSLNYLEYFTPDCCEFNQY